MVDLETARGAVLREAHEYAARLRGVDDVSWRRPTRCAGWTVRDLAIHLAGASDAQATSLERMRQGGDESPSIGRPELADAPRGRILDDLDAGVAHLASAVEALNPTDLDGSCPLPFGLLPGVVALQIVTFEHGIHGNDLRWALGDEAPLAPDVIRAAAAAMGAALPLLAQRSEARPVDGTHYSLRGDTVSLAYVAEGGEWRLTQGDHRAPSAEVSGSDSAVMLFAMGRIEATHHSLRVTGDVNLAQRFKAYFPGP